jgi:hypothetical protein
MRRVGSEPIRHNEVIRQDDLRPSWALENTPDLVDHGFLDERVTDPIAAGFEECETHSAADEHEVDLRQEVFDHIELVGHLRPTEDDHVGTVRFAEQTFEGLNLAFEQPSRGGREPVCNADIRRVGAMGRSEGVVDEHVCQGRESGGDLGIILRLPRLETGVLEDHDRTFRSV